MRAFLLILAALFSFGVSTPADAGVPASRLRVVHKGGQQIPPPPPPSPPLDQTAYWGPKTLVGDGGYDPCKALCVLPILSSPDTTNFYYDATKGGIVPKNGAVKTYNSVRPTPLSGTEDFVLTDSGSHTITVHNVANASIAGDYTVLWHNGDSVSSTSGTNQLFQAYSKMAYGEAVRLRGGSFLNTIYNTGEASYHGQQVFRFTCNLGTCLTPANFTGANYKVIGPEVGSVVTVGPMTLEGTGITGTHITGLLFDGEDTAVCIQNTACGNFFGGVTATYVWFDGNTMIGNTNDTYGRSRINGIKLSLDSQNWQFSNNDISWVYNGIQVAQPTGTYPADQFGTAPATTGFYLGYNTFRNISKDVFDTACMHHTVIEHNLFTDKTSAVIIDANYWNPFDSSHQVHSDALQMDGQSGGGAFACVYQFYPGNRIEYNMVLRGIGIDSMPFWTAPPYPNPNITGSVTSTSPARIVNAAAGLGSAQGIYASNYLAGGGGLDHRFPGTSVQRPYNIVWTDASVKYNVVMTEFQNALLLPDIGGTSEVVGNVCIATHPPAANLYDTTWGLGIAKCAINAIQGSTSTVDRNISGGTGSYPGTFTGTNVNVSNSNLAAAFQSPGANGSPRDDTSYKAGYLPIQGGPLQIAPHVYAGPYCPGGSINTGTCPEVNANDNAPPRISDGLWSWAA